MNKSFQAASVGRNWTLKAVHKAGSQTKAKPRDSWLWRIVYESQSQDKSQIKSVNFTSLLGDLFALKSKKIIFFQTVIVKMFRCALNFLKSCLQLKDLYNLFQFSFSHGSLSKDRHKQKKVENQREKENALTLPPGREQQEKKRKVVRLDKNYSMLFWGKSLATYD